MKFAYLLVGLVLAGCASVDEGDYRPVGSKERAALVRADRSVTLAMVKSDLVSHQSSKVAWAGIIRDVQYREAERTVQVAFRVEHRNFDWLDRGGRQPFKLSSVGEGEFVAGWVVNKPTRISYLKKLAATGDMLIVYGRPYRLRNGIVQLEATAVRPVKAGRFLGQDLP